MEHAAGATPIPERLARIGELAGDLWWSWDRGAREVFRRLDYPLWRATAHNPVKLLRLVSPARLADAGADASFVRLYDAAVARLDDARAARHT